ncbi:hypothetical protein [Marinomonas algarum]|uniref:Uncharacterized protein n=1 Tax=Marinomonas algarum TaxID=2883105 RepID=A0A9X1IP80_9GAMM|nr:hypothetical protein [Marinomonas algarum]MCB5162617.1 hypothetical protein [Marinomonas algarum]
MKTKEQGKYPSNSSPEQKASEKARAWYDELEVIVGSIDEADMECHGVTFLASHLLKKNGISHRCHQGYAEDSRTGALVIPHYWLEMGDGWVLDFRLRMWLEFSDDIPHGAFFKGDYSYIKYHGGVCEVPKSFEDGTDDLLIEANISHISMPKDFLKERDCF